MRGDAHKKPRRKFHRETCGSWACHRDPLQELRQTLGHCQVHESDTARDPDADHGVDASGRLAPNLDNQAARAAASSRKESCPDHGLSTPGPIPPHAVENGAASRRIARGESGASPQRPARRSGPSPTMRASDGAR